MIEIISFNKNRFPLLEISKAHSDCINNELRVSCQTLRVEVYPYNNHLITIIMG